WGPPGREGGRCCRGYRCRRRRTGRRPAFRRFQRYRERSRLLCETRPLECSTRIFRHWRPKVEWPGNFGLASASRSGARGRGPGEKRLPGRLSFLPAYNSDLRIFSTTYSPARIERASIVSVGFCDPPETKLLPSMTKRFFTSCDWLNAFSTLF